MTFLGFLFDSIVAFGLSLSSSYEFVLDIKTHSLCGFSASGYLIVP